MNQTGATFALAAPTVFDGDAMLAEHCVMVRDQVIEEVLPVAGCPDGMQLTRLDSGTLAPGFIDLQVNGGGDILFNNAPTTETLHIMQRAHRSRGTTALMPTLVSDTRAVSEAAVAAVTEARNQGLESILGIHLEGPFLAASKHGAHDRDKLRAPDPADLDWLCGLAGFPVMLTLAPECVAPQQLARLAASGLHLCAGHTDASYEQMAAAVANGLSGVTHLYNAMSPLRARQPGAVGAALTIDALWAGIIADGHHVHTAAIRLALAAKPVGKLVLVSDAMAGVGGHRADFELYGEVIREREGRLVNAKGDLAGSAIGLIDAVAHMHNRIGLSLEEALRMASLYPATILGIDHVRGRLRPGLRADMVHFDDNFAVKHTWVGGEQALHGGEKR